MAPTYITWKAETPHDTDAGFLAPEKVAIDADAKLHRRSLGAAESAQVWCTRAFCAASYVPDSDSDVVPFECLSLLLGFYLLVFWGVVRPSSTCPVVARRVTDIERQ